MHNNLQVVPFFITPDTGLLHHPNHFQLRNLLRKKLKPCDAHSKNFLLKVSAKKKILGE
jgi:hypothetical protein